MNAIEVRGVKKSYGHDFALHDVNLEVKMGKIFALLGPNGAGKTTLVKLILNLMHADHGEIKIKGIPSYLASSRIGVGFIPEKFSFFPYYTVRGVLEFFGTMKGLSGLDLKSQIDNALKDLDIEVLQNRKLQSLSKGQVQRTGLASLLVGEHDVLILDEPFSGLDPIGMRDLKDIIRKQRAAGKTIFLNSHILSEMEQICDDAAILNKGEILFSGSIQSILDQGQTLEDFFYQLVSKRE
ncbi:MAG: ABC transporter ATP-binding protein [Bacteriovorax sp.]|nr:ABC transporter ATP-binding protein [Bacteriovorax sp.]